MESNYLKNINYEINQAVEKYIADLQKVKMEIMRRDKIRGVTVLKYNYEFINCVYIPNLYSPVFYNNNEKKEIFPKDIGGMVKINPTAINFIVHRDNPFTYTIVLEHQDYIKATISYTFEYLKRAEIAYNVQKAFNLLYKEIYEYKNKQ